MGMERRIDVANLTAAFRTFVNAPKRMEWKLVAGGLMVTAYCHVVLRFGMSGTIRLLPLHTFIAWTEPTLPLNIQGVTGGTDQTSGECSLGQTIPI